MQINIYRKKLLMRDISYESEGIAIKTDLIVFRIIELILNKISSLIIIIIKNK